MARIGVSAVAVYIGAGALFAVPFLSRGIGRIDPVARGTSLGFRLIVAPGVVALWPWFAVRWVRATRGADPDAHS